MYDIWNNNFIVVEKIYNHGNYHIVTNANIKNKVCYIFFSSNNIWFPNTEEAFRHSFIENNYYEWMNYSSLPAEKIIYVRDIYKSWYVTGINSKLNSVDSVIDFLKEQTINMKVITVGSSAGGYMASLVAALLNAKYCICFSAQFDLITDGVLGSNPFLKKYLKDKERSKYYNIIDIIKNSETCIFYIMPAYSETDITQSNKVKEIPNIKTMKISSRRHGVPMFTGNLNNLLSMNITRLNAFFDTKQGKVMGMISISIELTGLIGTINCIKKEIIKIAKKYIRK